MRLRDYAHHHVAAFCLIVFCAWLSLSLIVRLWLKHRNDPFLKRLGWSFILCVPFFGWLLYGAFYTPLRENDVRAESNPDIMSGGH